MPFSKKSFQFLSGLARNNSKEWFDAHRETYEQEIKAPSLEFAETLLKLAPKLALPFQGEAKKSIFRQHRDVRFSQNKDPYKTHTGISLSPTGAKLSFGLCYTHLDPKEMFWAAGFYMPEPPQIKKFRQAILQNEIEFLKIATNLEKKGWVWDETKSLKKMPAGTQKWEETDLARFLKLKSFTVSKKFETEDATSVKFAENSAKEFKNTIPLLNFGWTKVAPANSSEGRK